MSESTLDRRDFLRASAAVSAAGMAAFAGEEVLSAEPQQTVPGGPARRPNRYDEDVLFSERKPFRWPGGARLAVWFIPNVEAFVFQPTAGAAPDVPGFSWREYGMRVGLWRMMDAMDEFGVRGTVALNAAVCELYPKAIEAMTQRGWEMMGHNLTNSRSLRNLPPVEEDAIIHTTLRVIQEATGKPVRGWLGSGLAETPDTLDVLAAAGVRYTGDWNHDDLPVRMKVKSGEMHGLPYGNEVNDIRFFGAGHTGEEYAEMLTDQFDALYADAAAIPRVLGIPLHPFHTGQPLRIKYLERAMAYFKRHEGVWYPTGTELLDAYLAAQG